MKAEIAIIDLEKVQPTLFTSSAPLPVINPTYPFLPSTSSRTYDPSKIFGITHTLFPPHPRPQSKPKKTPKLVPVQKSIPQKNPQTSRFEPSPTSLPEYTQPPPIQPFVPIEKQPMYQYFARQISHSLSLDYFTKNSPSQSDLSSTKSSDLSNSDTSDSSILMVTKTEDPSASTSTPIVEGSSFDHENENPSNKRERKITRVVCLD